MAAKRFPSKIDRWLILVFAAAMISQFVALTAVLMYENDPWAVLIITATTLAAAVFIGSLFRFTYYSVEGRVLKVVCGPFRWRVPLDEITSVEPTRNPLSSPALSLDRLRIEYGGRTILVSPADKAGFLRAIGQDRE
jgi:hypothetical protein